MQDDLFERSYNFQFSKFPPDNDSVVEVKKEVDYKFGEGQYLDELRDYVDNTYNEHYSKNKFQATEFIVDSGHGEGFCLRKCVEIHTALW